MEVIQAFETVSRFPTCRYCITAINQRHSCFWHPPSQLDGFERGNRRSPLSICLSIHPKHQPGSLMRFLSFVSISPRFLSYRSFVGSNNWIKRFVRSRCHLFPPSNVTLSSVPIRTVAFSKDSRLDVEFFPPRQSPSQKSRLSVSSCCQVAAWRASSKRRFRKTVLTFLPPPSVPIHLSETLNEAVLL